MQYHYRWIIAVMLAALPLVGCSDKKQDKPSSGTPPVTVAPSQESGISRITLTDRSAARIGIQIAEVKAADQGVEAPYSALLYDASGSEWIYANPEPLVYKRIGVKVDRIEGDKMYLSKGPSVGTKVVTVGAVELFGAEFEIGH